MRICSLRAALLLVASLALLLCLGQTGRYPAALAAGGDRTANASSASPGTIRVFVTFASSGSPSDAAQEDSFVRANGGDVRHHYKLVPSVDIEVSQEQFGALAADSRVARIELDSQVQAADAQLDNSWGVKHVGAGTNHDAGIRGAGVKVGVIDTGINTTHVDLDGNYNPACSYDFVNHDSDPSDDNGHGSHVTGIIAAEDNNTGVVGMAPSATICAYKVLGATGGGSYGDIIAALDRAVTDGVRVVNLSLGSTGDPGSTVAQAFTNAYSAGLVIVAAAGNSGTCAGTDDSVIYPARYPEVIAVSATDSNDIAPCFSSTGPKVELAAPGVGVTSDYIGSTTALASLSGTSMASPHVAGLAAEIVGCAPNLTNGQVRTVMDASAKDLDSPLVAGFPDGRDTWYGYGLIQAPAAVALAGCSASPTPTFTLVPPTATPTRTNTPTATRTPTFTPTATSTFTPTSTSTFSPTSTSTFSPTSTLTFTPTSASTFTPTSTSTFTPASASTFTPTSTSTFTPASTPTPTATFTPTPTNTFTPTQTDTPTPVPTDTPTPPPLPASPPTPTLTPTPTDPATPTPTDTPTPTPTPAPGSAPFYSSLSSNGTVGGLSVANEDIVAWNGSTFSLYFDGSDVGLSSTAIDAFAIISPNEILMSFIGSFSVPGVGAVTGSDIVKFTATSLGDTTAGTFSLYFHSSDVGLTTTGENVDALEVLPNGHLLISTTGNFNVPGASGRGEDILEFTPTTLGPITAGTWSIYFDGSDVGLSGSSENVDAIAVDTSGKVYLSTAGNFSVPGVSGANEDIFVFTPSSLGSTTAGTYSSTLFFDGSVYGFGSNNIVGFDLP